MRKHDRLQAILETRWIGYVVGPAAVGLMGLLIGLVLSHIQVANLSMLYLIVVLVTAVTFGRGPAIIVSIAAFLTFDWFFVQPLHTFTIGTPEEWIALILFLLTAVITGQLAAGQRQRAEEAEQREREAVVLYDVVRLMTEPDLGHALHAVAERLRQELLLAGVCIELSETDGLANRTTVGDDDALELLGQRVNTGVRILGSGSAPTSTRRGAPGPWIRVVPPQARASRPVASDDRLQVVPISVQSRRVGDLLIVRRAGVSKFSGADDRLLLVVAAQLGLAVERVRLQREVTEAEILRRTDELKTALLNAVSHDLRTPLASIIASAGSLRQHDVSWTEEERQEFAEAIEEEALRLNQIVGNLLDLSRMEGGSLRPEKGWYDLGALIDDIIGRLRPLIEKRRIIVDVQEELPPILLDYVEIDQVISNLIENAAKYTAPDTEIHVSARRTDGEVQVQVSDRGPGIPASALPHLFEPFFRANYKGPRPKGTGLGLAVAKGLVEAHGGRIWAGNRRDGGASFIFTLPLEGPVARGSVAASPQEEQQK